MKTFKEIVWPCFTLNRRQQKVNYKKSRGRCEKLSFTWAGNFLKMISQLATGRAISNDQYFWATEPTPFPDLWEGYHLSHNRFFLYRLENTTSYLPVFGASPGRSSQNVNEIFLWPRVWLSYFLGLVIISPCRWGVEPFQKISVLIMTLNSIWCLTLRFHFVRSL